MEDGELLQERIATTVTSLLGLLNIDADPLQSREHILLSNIFENYAPFFDSGYNGAKIAVQ